MSVFVQTKEFRQALNLMRKVIPKDHENPVLTYVKFSVNAKTGKASLIGSNLDETVSCQLSCDVADYAFECLIQFAELQEALKGCRAKDVAIEYRQDLGKVLVCFKSGDVLQENTAKALPVSEWPELPDGEMEVINFDRGFLPGFIPVAQSRSTDKGRPNINHILIDEAHVVGTDGSELTFFPHGLEVDSHILLPVTKMLQAVFVHAMPGSIGSFKYLCDYYAWISTEAFTYTVKMPEVQFPNYKQILPTVSATTITTIPESELDDLINTVSEFICNDEHEELVIQIDEDKLTISNADESSSYKSNAITTGNPVIFYIARQRFLNAIDKELNRLEVFSPEQPIQFSNNKHISLIMPLLSARWEKSRPVVSSPKPTLSKPKEEKKTMPKPELEVVPEKDPFTELMDEAQSMVQSAKDHYNNIKKLPTLIRNAQNSIKQKEKALSEARKVFAQLQNVSGF